MALQNHYPLIRHWKDVYDMVKEVDSPWLKICLDLPMMTRFDADFVRQAALTVGNLQVHSHFGGEFTRDASGQVRQRPFDFEKPVPDYAQFLSFMREIGYDGYFTYELCHPFLNDRHQLRGLGDVDEQASLAREFQRPAGARVAADWARRKSGPVIRKLTAEFDRMREGVTGPLLTRFNGKLTPEEKQAVEYAFRLFQNQLLHGPIAALHESSAEAGHGTLLDALKKMFRLGE